MKPNYTSFCILCCNLYPFSTAFFHCYNNGRIPVIAYGRVNWVKSWIGSIVYSALCTIIYTYLSRCYYTGVKVELAELAKVGGMLVEAWYFVTANNGRKQHCVGKDGERYSIASSTTINGLNECVFHNNSEELKLHNQPYIVPNFSEITAL
jgi:hypothetical protein